LLRAMRETGDQFRQGKIAPYAAATTGQVDSSWVDVAANGNR